MAPIHVHLQMGPFQELEAESGSRSMDRFP